MEGAYLLKYVSTMPFIGTADTYFIGFQLLAETIDKYETWLFILSEIWIDSSFEHLYLKV